MWVTLIVQTLCLNTHSKTCFNLKNIFIYLGWRHALIPTCSYIRGKKGKQYEACYLFCSLGVKSSGCFAFASTMASGWLAGGASDIASVWFPKQNQGLPDRNLLLQSSWVMSVVVRCASH